MFGKRKTRLCPEGWYYLVVMGFMLAGALLRDINLLLLVFGLMFAALLLSWRHVARSLRKLRVRRELPSSVCAGEPLVVDLHALNGRRHGTSWAVVVEDRICREAQGAKAEKSPPLKPRILFARLRPQERQTQAYEGQLVERGRYRLGPLRVTTKFPLGVVQRTEVLDEPASLLVLPRRGRLTPRWYQRNQRAYLAHRGTKHSSGLPAGDFHSLRDYRPGDGRNRVHWRTSARRGELMVRQFEQQQNRDMAVLLELWRPKDPTWRHRDNIELAVSFAATVLSDQCCRGGNQLLLGIAGVGTTLLRGPASTALLGEFLEALALAEGAPGDRLPDLLAQGVPQMPRHGELVLISTRPIDLNEAAGRAGVQSDPKWQAVCSRSLMIDAGNDELLEYFEPL
jgi:uncharacterized protein (DUF58 family)